MVVAATAVPTKAGFSLWCYLATPMKVGGEQISAAGNNERLFLLNVVCRSEYAVKLHQPEQELHLTDVI